MDNIEMTTAENEHIHLEQDMNLKTLHACEEKIKKNFNMREQEVAKLLSEMRDGSHSLPGSPVPPPTPTFDCSSTSSSTMNESTVGDGMSIDTPIDGNMNFISRVSQLPVVNTTIKTIGEVYQNGKNTSRVLRYSAETVESSVRTILDNTKPMLSRFEPSLEQLDVFACKQLDKLEKKFGFSENEISAVHGQKSSSMFRWNEYISAESLRSLQICIEWLKFCTAHLESQISLLRNGMSRLASNSDSSIVGALLALATAVRREVVETMKYVVDIVGKYAGSALPVEARNTVRGFILSLPSRWSQINNAVTSSNGESAEAQRVLSLAEESRNILLNTLNVFGSTSATLEYWFGQSAQMKSHQE